MKARTVGGGIVATTGAAAVAWYVALRDPQAGPPCPPGRNTGAYYLELVPFAPVAYYGEPAPAVKACGVTPTGKASTSGEVAIVVGVVNDSTRFAVRYVGTWTRPKQRPELPDTAFAPIACRADRLRLIRPDGRRTDSLFLELRLDSGKVAPLPPIYCYGPDFRDSIRWQGGPR